MSGWNFDHAGRFGSEDEARRHAASNRIDPRDVRTRGYGTQTELEIRRSADEAPDRRPGGWK